MLAEKILKLIALLFCLNFTGNLLYILGAIIIHWGDGLNI